MQRLLRGTALAVNGGGGHAFGKLGGQHRVARDVHALLTGLIDATDDHVFDEGGIDLGAVHKRVENFAAEICGVPIFETTAFAATCGTCGGNDICFCHEALLSCGDGRRATGRPDLLGF